MAEDDRHCTVRRLQVAREAGQALSPLMVAAAAAHGVSPRTVWRWLATEVPEGRWPRWRPGDADIDAYVRWRGNAAAAWRERTAEHPGLPTLRTFQRAITQALTPGDRAVVRDGVAGRRRHQVYLRWEPEARNAMWEADHVQLDVPVLFARAQRPRKPWLTTVLDGYSRAVMGWAIAEHPSSATVIAALGEGIRLDAERDPFAGIPAVLRPDRGLEFAAGVLTRACGVLAIHLAPTQPYSPHLKGKIERFHRSIAELLLADMPQYSGGPRDAARRLWGGSAPPLSLAEFVAAFARWVDWYNGERPHEALGGQTPLQRWLEDATPLRSVPDEELRWTLLDGGTRTVVTSGIRLHGLHFIAPELNGLVGETVGVRFRPHDNTSVEIFHHDRHLCTALPQGVLNADQRAAVLARRRDDAAAQARRQRRAARQTRQRHSPATAHADAEDVTVIRASLTERSSSRRGEHELRQQASADLLQLRPIAAP